MRTYLPAPNQNEFEHGHENKPHWVIVLLWLCVVGIIASGYVIAVGWICAKRGIHIPWRQTLALLIVLICHPWVVLGIIGIVGAVALWWLFRYKPDI